MAKNKPPEEPQPGDTPPEEPQPGDNLSPTQKQVYQETKKADRSTPIKGLEREVPEGFSIVISKYKRHTDTPDKVMNTYFVSHVNPAIAAILKQKMKKAKEKVVAGGKRTPDNIVEIK